MRKPLFGPLFWVVIAISITAMAILMLGSGGSVAGLSPDGFASVAILSAWAMVIGAGLFVSRNRVRPRLWHVALWLAILVAVMAGYHLYQGASVPAATEARQSF